MGGKGKVQSLSPPFALALCRCRRGSCTSIRLPIIPVFWWVQTHLHRCMKTLFFSAKFTRYCYRANSAQRGICYGPMSVCVCLSVCVCVCVYVCLSVTSRSYTKWLNVRTRKQRQTAAYRLQFSAAKDLDEIRTSHRQRRRQMQVG